MTRSSMIILLAALAAPAGAQAQNKLDHGRHAFNTAQRFAKQNNLSFFVRKQGGVDRIVINVPRAKLPRYISVFGMSKWKGFVEPYFKVNQRGSFLRRDHVSNADVGRGGWYNTGERHTGRTSFSEKVAFPIHLSPQEYLGVHKKVLNGQSEAFPGTPPSSRTRWLTRLVGKYTGYKGTRRDDHLRKLATDPSSRMTVTAVITKSPVAADAFNESFLKALIPK